MHLTTSFHQRMIDLCPVALQQISNGVLYFINFLPMAKNTHPLIRTGVSKIAVCKTGCIFNKITNSAEVTSNITMLIKYLYLIL